MPSVLRLTVVTGPHKDEKFCFCGPSHCLIGRDSDCFIQLAGTHRDRLISRHHCELIIEPPVLKLSDLASRNGTFINGIRVATESSEPNMNADWKALDSDAILCHGDLLTAGGTTFRVELVECSPKSEDAGKEPFWEEGEVAKKGCPIQCQCS